MKKGSDRVSDTGTDEQEQQEGQTEEDAKPDTEEQSDGEVGTSEGE